MLRRCFPGYARHLDAAGVLTIGHGCEVLQVSELHEALAPGGGAVL